MTIVPAPRHRCPVCDGSRYRMQHLEHEVGQQGAPAQCSAVWECLVCGKRVQTTATIDVEVKVQQA